jgi:two-component system sensor histidine kinase QseC
MIWRLRSLQARLLTTALALVVALLAILAGAVWHQLRGELDALLDSHLAQAAALLVVQQGHEISDGDLDLDVPVLDTFAPKVAFQVYQRGGLAMQSANAPHVPMIPLARKGIRGFSTVSLEGLTWRVFAAPGPEHALQVYVAERVDSRDAILWTVLRGIVQPALIALPILALALWWAIARGVHPLRQLDAMLAERKPLDETPVFLLAAPAELVPVVDALNGLLARIRSLLLAERRFTADAAHELRTPIAAIRAQAQVALGERDDALRRHALQATLAGCDRATHLAAQLLTLSRIESEGLPPMQPQPLGPVLRQVLADLAPAALRKGQDLEADIVDDCRLHAEPTLLAVLIRNIVDNAIRYSPTGASIRVAGRCDGTHVILEVEDSGPGMSETDLARIGERFFRVLGAQEAGSGLGWSIVQRIALVHDAALEVMRSVRLGGLAVRVTWARAGMQATLP